MTRSPTGHTLPAIAIATHRTALFTPRRRILNSCGEILHPTLHCWLSLLCPRNTEFMHIYKYVLPMPVLRNLIACTARVCARIARAYCSLSVHREFLTLHHFVAISFRDTCAVAGRSFRLCSSIRRFLLHVEFDP